MNKELIEKFETLLSSTKREGINLLLEIIRKSDFYEAPASTRFHGCREGCLLEHSLNVYERCIEKFENGFWHDVLTEHKVTKENVIISALLHDLCKMYYYVIDYKNQKVYSDTGKKHDEKGKFNWEVVPYYTVDDKIPYGHGEKSVMMIEQYIKLESVERYAIRWHMGAYSGQQDWNTLGLAIEKYPLVLALQEADMEASKLMEE